MSIKDRRNDLPLELILITILTQDVGRKYTDLHVEEGHPIMGRISSNRWEPALDSDGNQIKVSKRMIEGFMTSLYRAQSDVLVNSDPQMGWEAQLKTRYSLHPSMYLDVGEHNGDNIEGQLVRVRVTVQRQGLGNKIGLMIRALHELPESVASLGLPVQVSTMTKSNAGLILVCGATGAGKTTTVAAMIHEINSTRYANILTIEDPVEYVHERIRSIINPREIGVDVDTFENGVKDALRFAPDVIMIGEIRDPETMRAALRAAESGHLVLATMHAASSFNAVRKVMGYLQTPAEELSFSTAFVGAITQALLVDEEGGKHLAFEVLSGKTGDTNPQKSVQEAIASVIQDRSGSKLTALEGLFRKGQLGPSSIPMIDSLRKLATNSKLSNTRIASAAYHIEDAAEILNAR